MNGFQYSYTKKEKIKRIVLILAIVVLVIFGIIVYSNQKYKEKGVSSTEEESSNVASVEETQKESTNTLSSNDQKVEVQEENNIITEQIVLSDDASKSYSYIVEKEESYQVQLPTVSNTTISVTKEENKTKEDTVSNNNTSITKEEEKTTSTEEVLNNSSVENKDSEEKQEEKKIGTFSATLYNAIAWANQSLNVRKSANGNSSKIGTIPTGGKMAILSAMDSKTKYIKVKYGKTTGYVYSNYIMINLPDVIPDMYYEITNAKGSIYKSAGYSISGVTEKNLYGFTKKYNSKIGKETYYAPLLFPVAKQLQKAYNVAVKQGYNLKVYDSYRPYPVTKSVYSRFLTLYNNNSTVRQKILYDKNGAYWGPGWCDPGSYLL